MTSTADAAGAQSLPQPLDPVVLPFVDLIPDLSMDDETVRDIRALMGGITSPLDDEAAAAVTIEEHTVDEARGVIARVIRPAGPVVARPCVYAIHGGGYVIGTRLMDDQRAAAWATDLGITTVSIEYRLAPEHAYPAALDDCYDGLRWVHEHAELLGVDPGRTGVYGTSAGGGLAAALAIRARDRGELPVAFQLLDSPMLDDRQVTPSSRADWLVVWTKESNEYGWRSYLGDLYGTDDIPAEAAPARSDDLRGLPPALVLVGGADGFRDEDVLYALRLNQAGVPAELHVYPGGPHGFTLFPDSGPAKTAGVDINRWLGERTAG